MSENAIASPHQALAERPANLDLFVGIISTIGLLLVAHSLYVLPYTPHLAGWVAVGLLAVVASYFTLTVPGLPVYLSTSDTFYITSVVLFGPAPATVTMALDSMVMSWRRGNATRQTLFNATSSAIALWAAGQTFFLILPTGPLADASALNEGRTVVALFCLAAVYFVLNSGLIAAAVAGQKRVPIFPLWRARFAVVGVTHFAAASASFLLLVLLKYASPFALAAILPLVAIVYLAMRSSMGRLEDAQRHVATVNKLYLSTISAMSTAIEAKDGVTSDHIHRVQSYAVQLARQMGFDDAPTLQAVEAAALLHDTGKLAIPEYILNKPGKLTTSEFEIMKSHVDIGADILSSIDFPYPVVPIVRAHHENWDGSGYPAGLRGEQIPIGARILSVVDCFDALLSDRPYRPAMPQAEALGILIERSGSMYDPRVVDAFVRMAAALPGRTPSRDEREPRPAPAPPTVNLEIAAPRQPLHDVSVEHADVLPFVSLARLATQRATVADVGQLAAAAMLGLAPGATVALYINDERARSLTVRYAGGADAGHLMGLTHRLGDRLTGWVAANNSPVANSDARLDFASSSCGALRYAAATPLNVEGRLIGVLTLYAADPFGEHQIRMLTALASPLAVAISTIAAMEIGLAAGERPLPIASSAVR